MSAPPKLQPEPVEPIPLPKRKISSRVFIRFASRESFIDFQNNKASYKEAQTLKKTSSAQSQKSIPSPINLHRASKSSTQQQISSVMMHDSISVQCKNCRIILLVNELERGICVYCDKIQKFRRSKNFENFVLFVLDFKSGKIPSYNSVTRLKRGQSIQSIQSVTVDKPNESQLKQSNFKLKNSVKYGFDSKSLKGSKKFNISRRQNSLTATQGLTSGGYFCNDCGANPIQGRRFHCLMCTDFDMCQRCYFSVGHKHQMKTCADSKENVIKKMRERTLKQSNNLKSTIPLLSASIQKFENTPKNLYSTFQLKKKANQNK